MLSEPSKNINIHRIQWSKQFIYNQKKQQQHCQLIFYIVTERKKNHTSPNECGWKTRIYQKYNENQEPHKKVVKKPIYLCK